MSILEELWYGNVHPGELNIKKHSPYKELLALMIRHQDDLLPRCIFHPTNRACTAE